MSKLIMFIGGVVGMGLVWFFGAVWAIGAIFSITVDSYLLGTLALLCFTFAACFSWKLFVTPGK